MGTFKGFLIGGLFALVGLWIGEWIGFKSPELFTAAWWGYSVNMVFFGTGIMIWNKVDEREKRKNND